MLSHVYQCIATRWHPEIKPNVILYYSDDRDEAIRYLHKYYMKHGYSIQEGSNEFAIADLVLREQYSDGQPICEIPMRYLYDSITNERKKPLKGKLEKFVGNPIKDDDTIIIYQNGEEVPFMHGFWMCDAILGFMDREGELQQMRSHTFRFDLKEGR